MIRPATERDIPQLAELIKELALYEKEPDAAIATAADIHDLLFVGSATPGGVPASYCHVAVDESQPDEVLGMALWFLNTSTWLGKHGLYLEDLYVRDSARGQGYGQQLLASLAAVCVERNYGRLEWWVLDWNSPAIDFYTSQGATPMSDWTTFRVSGPALTELADRAQGSPNY